MPLLHNVSVKLPTSEHEKLKSIASAKNRTPHFLMREAIRQYIEREEESSELWKEAMQSWDDYQKTGLHLTGDEVFQWIDTFVKSKALIEPPKCHV